jgi:hypothetical protein
MGSTCCYHVVAEGNELSGGLERAYLAINFVAFVCVFLNMNNFGGFLLPHLYGMGVTSLLFFRRHAPVSPSSATDI